MLKELWLGFADRFIRNYRCLRCKKRITWNEIERNLWGEVGFCNKCEIIEQENLRAYLRSTKEGQGMSPLLPEDPDQSDGV
jgi:hypothetical protein